MQIGGSKFLKVWKVEIDQQGRKKVNLGDSKKNQDGTYTNWTWFFCNLVGNAKGVQLNEGDTVTINSGKIEMYKTNSGEYRTSITIFDIEVTARADQQGNNQQYKPSNNNNSYNPNNDPRHNQGNNNGSFDDSIPF